MTFTTDNHIIVSGAGVSGLAAAFWFAKQGATVTVLERAAELRTGGHAVDFRGQAVEALRRMGLYDAVIGAATGEVDTWYVDSRGRRRASLPQEIMGGEIEIVRGDLIQVLAEAAISAGASIRFGTSIASIAQRPDVALVTVDSGETFRADLVVAADGLHSNVRSLVFGDERNYLKTLGYTAAVFSTDNFLGLKNAGRFHSEPGRTVGVTNDRDSQESRVALYYTDETAERPRSLDDQRRMLRERFGADGWVVPEILARLDLVEDLYFDPMTLVHIDSYSAGRVVLLGDAGYSASPLSGMGTSLAIIGAYVLAHEVSASGDLADGLDAYEQRMRPLVAACQKLADGAAQFFVPGNRAMIAIRDLTYRVMPYLPWKGVFAEIPTKAANSIQLRIGA